MRQRATIITQTPMRITLGGGGTDVLWYSKKYGGAWISATIDKYVFVTLNIPEDKNLIRISHGDTAAFVNDVNDIPNEIIRECMKLVGVTSGIEISTVADASARSGLGGSGAFEVGVLNALYTYLRKPVSPIQLGKEACYIEMDKMGKSIGPQDQYIVSLGGIKYFEINNPNGEVDKVEDIDISSHTVSELEHNLLFFRTGIMRDANSVLLDQKQKAELKSDQNEVIEALHQIKELGQKVKRYLEEGDLDAFGKSLDIHWLIKKRLSKKVTSSQIDFWYTEAMKSGALGGKIMGAGGGGWFMFYVPKDKQKFREKMAQIGLEEKKCRFDWEGTKVIINLS
ncbi:hypothetical protein A2335_01095 [Candidatus Peregrinibacteria bacterium RIFOXYB2_FULL_32_7]|nr:MAG: hypothetical protein A2335_01095 [Candidatus Peregrinibacteria bacterium RIFOXYB2_FULL_32_7]